jgi:hypothetical protein
MNTNSILGVIVGIALVTTLVLQQAEALAEGHELSTKVPSAMSGDNIYIAWWTNKTGNDEVMFRVSNDAGGTFGDKINLSNTTTTDSQDVDIAADGSNVVVTWWECNQTSNEPAARISTDDGLTFGPILKLSTNGSVGANVEQE